MRRIFQKLFVALTLFCASFPYIRSSLTQENQHIGTGPWWPILGIAPKIMLVRSTPREGCNLRRLQINIPVMLVISMCIRYLFWYIRSVERGRCHSTRRKTVALAAGESSYAVSHGRHRPRHGMAWRVTETMSRCCCHDLHNKFREFFSGLTISYIPLRPSKHLCY